MKKKLTIGITHYNEDYEVIKPLLTSISLQRGVNLDEIEVIIVNDGDEGILPDDIYSFNFDVKYVINEKSTVSAARNRVIDEAQGEYVMLCDCDDMFYTPTALYIIFREIDNGGFDGLVDAFLEESKHPETQEILYVDHQGTDLFVHGKVWRKKYLDDNNIRFRPELTIHEETPFTYLAMGCSQNVKLCPVPFYLWCWNDASVCRRDPLYLLKTYNNMIDSQTAIAEEFLKRDMTVQAKQFVVGMVYNAYYSLCCKEWKNINNKEYRDAVEEKFKVYFDRFKYLWDEVGEQDKLMISNQIRQQTIMEGRLEMENITMQDFLKKF